MHESAHSSKICGLIGCVARLVPEIRDAFSARFGAVSYLSLEEVLLALHRQARIHGLDSTIGDGVFLIDSQRGVCEIKLATTNGYRDISFHSILQVPPACMAKGNIQARQICYIYHNCDMKYSYRALVGRMKT